jgi:hypothetical protein
LRVCLLSLAFVCVCVGGGGIATAAGTGWSSIGVCRRRGRVAGLVQAIHASITAGPVFCTRMAL